jgi:hypothetical protein
MYIEHDACLPSTMGICDMKKGLDGAAAPLFFRIIRASK